MSPRKPLRGPGAGRRLALLGILAGVALVALAIIVLGSTDPEKPGSTDPANPSANREEPGVWRADFETGDFSQWEGVQEHSPDRASVVESPVEQGRYAGRFEVREGEFIGADAPNSNRTEAVLSGGRHEPKEGDESWYRWSFFLPKSTPLPADASQDFMIITQWRANDESDLVGVLEFRDHEAVGDPGPGHVELSYGGAAGQPPFEGPFWAKDAGQITRDTWHEFVLRKKWSSDPAAGFVEIWYDGVKQTMKDGSTRVYHSNLSKGLSAYMKQGVYRSNAIGGTAVIYLDGLRIGPTRQSVGK